MLVKFLGDFITMYFGGKQRQGLNEINPRSHIPLKNPSSSVLHFSAKNKERGAKSQVN